MKNLIVVLLLMIHMNQIEADTVSQFRWLEGTWERMDMKAGRTGLEIWEWQESQLIGKGISMEAGDTTFVENLRIESVDGQFIYQAAVLHNEKPTIFMVVEIRPNYFRCENLNHDFPKVIAYTRTGDKLDAVISGNGKSIAFSFMKK